MQYFCTLFDRNYLPRGLALRESLLAANPDLRLIVLCLDKPTHDVLSSMKLIQVDLLLLEQLESFTPALAAARQNRSKVEYYFTCKSVLMSYVFDRFNEATRVTYLDADLYFFNDPSLLDPELAGSSVAVTPHDFHKNLEDFAQYGLFNAGWISVSSTNEGHEFLDWWQSKCLDWCQTTVEVERFADQKYLDQVPRLFPNAHVVTARGANVAPWNLGGRKLVYSDKVLRVEENPLIFFHFHALRRVWWRYYDSGLLHYRISLNPISRRHLYLPYLRALSRIESQVMQVCSERGGIVSDDGPLETAGRLALGRLPRVIWSLGRSGTGLFLH